MLLHCINLLYRKLALLVYIAVRLLVVLCSSVISQVINVLGYG